MVYLFLICKRKDLLLNKYTGDRQSFSFAPADSSQCSFSILANHYFCYNNKECIKSHFSLCPFQNRASTNLCIVPSSAFPRLAGVHNRNRGNWKQIQWAPPKFYKCLKRSCFSIHSFWREKLDEFNWNSKWLLTKLNSTTVLS